MEGLTILDTKEMNGDAKFGKVRNESQNGKGIGLQRIGAPQPLPYKYNNRQQERQTGRQKDDGEYTAP